MGTDFCLGCGGAARRTTGTSSGPHRCPAREWPLFARVPQPAAGDFRNHWTPWTSLAISFPSCSVVCHLLGIQTSTCGSSSLAPGRAGELLVLGGRRCESFHSQRTPSKDSKKEFGLLSPEILFAFSRTFVTAARLFSSCSGTGSCWAARQVGDPAGAQLCSAWLAVEAFPGIVWEV